MKHVRILLALLFALGAFASHAVAQNAPSVAAASDLKFALEEIATLFDLPFDDDGEPGEAAESMNLPTQDPFDFKNILRELDDKSDKKD